MLEFAGIFQQQDSGGGGPVAPTVVSITQSEVTVDSTTHNMSLPATVTNGDLLLMISANDGGSGDEPTTSASGWTKIENFSAAPAGGAIFKKLADGSEGGTTINLVSASVECMAAQCFRIQTWSGNIADVKIAAAPVSVPSGTSITPPSLTTGFGAVPTLWICATPTSSSAVTTSTPANYTITLTGTMGGAFGQIRTGWRQLTASSETPGAFEFDTTMTMVATTIAVRGTG